jgi:hypothetical protein
MCHAPTTAPFHPSGGYRSRIVLKVPDAYADNLPMKYNFAALTALALGSAVLATGTWLVIAILHRA